MNSSSNKKTNNTLDMVKMGKHIAELRKRKGYTQKKLGEILDISDKTISKWELGFIAPDITLINALAIALDVTIEEILRGEDISIEQNGIYNSKMGFEVDNYKSKKHSRFIILIVFIATIILFVFFIHNYSKWKLTEIDGKNDNFYVHGYILNNSNESKLIIDRINYINDEIGTQNDIYLSSVEVEVYLNDNKIFYKHDDVSSLSPSIEFYFNNYMILENLDYTVDDNNLYLHIEYHEKNNNNKKRYVINLGN